MNVITLQAIPNQSLTFTADNHFFEVSLKACQDMMIATVSRDNVTIIAGSRCVAGAMLLPYRYQEDGGNLAIVTDPGDAPWYEQFGVTQFLVYYPAAELAVARG